MAGLVGVRLKAIREFYGWSQRELAKRAGVPNSAISVIEQGSVSPSIISLEKVLKGFPISLADFFTISVNSSPFDILPPVAEANATALLADYPHPSGSAFSVRFYRQQPDDPPIQLLSRGQTLILLAAGEAVYHSLGVEHPLVRGNSVSLHAPALFRLRPVGGPAEWVVASLSR